MNKNPCILKSSKSKISSGFNAGIWLLFIPQAKLPPERQKALDSRSLTSCAPNDALAPTGAFREADLCSFYWFTEPNVLLRPRRPADLSLEEWQCRNLRTQAHTASKCKLNATYWIRKAWGKKSHGRQSVPALYWHLTLCHGDPKITQDAGSELELFGQNQSSTCQRGLEAYSGFHNGTLCSPDRINQEIPSNIAQEPQD